MLKRLMEKLKEDRPLKEISIDDLRYKSILKNVYYYIEDIELMKDSKNNMGYFLYKFKGLKMAVFFLLFLTCFIQKPAWCISE